MLLAPRPLRYEFTITNTAPARDPAKAVRTSSGLPTISTSFLVKKNELSDLSLARVNMENRIEI